MKHEKTATDGTAPQTRKNLQARCFREALRAEDKRLGIFMARVRRSSRMSQRRLAKRLNVPHSWVSKNEVAQRGVSVDDFIKWARGVDANPAELLEQFAAEHPQSDERAGSDSDAHGSC